MNLSNSLKFTLHLWYNLSLCLLLMFLAGAVFSQDINQQSGKTEIKILLPSLESSEASLTIEGKVKQAILDSFRVKYPDINIVGGSLPLFVAGLGTESHLLLSIAGGTAPDIIEFNFRKSGTYVAKGFLHPLDEWIDPEMTAQEAKAQGTFDENIMYKDELERRVHPKAMDALYTLGPDGKKHFYFLPFYNEVRIMAINKNLFRKAGLDPIKDVPKTWDEMWEIGKKLTNPEKETFGFMEYIGEHSSWAAAPFFLSMNPNRVKRDPLTGDWRAVFNGPGITEAADFFIKLNTKTWNHPESGETIKGIGSKDVWVKWYRDEIGMIFLTTNDILINSNYWISTRDYDEIGLAPIPKAPNGQSKSELYVHFMGIPVTTNDPKVREAAWKYMRFIGSDKGTEIAVDTYVKYNYANFVMPEYLKKYGYEEYVEQVPKDWVETVRYCFDNCEPEPYGANTMFIWGMMSEPVERAVHENLGEHPNKSYRLARLQEFYDEAVIEANEKMMKVIPPGEVTIRKTVAFILATLIFLMFIVLFIYIWRVFTPQFQDTAHGKSHLSKYKMAYFLLTPAVFLVLVFNYYPLVRGVFMAFQDYNIVGGSEYIGLTNFALVFFDERFWMSILVAGYYTLLFIALVFLPPIVLAIFLSEIPVGKIFYRIIYFLPAVISGVVMLMMWTIFFSSNSDGLLNQVIGLFGFAPHDWLGSKSTAMLSIMIPQAWAGLGIGCLIYLAALKTVPVELYEAVAIDGGGFYQRIRFVTIPAIKSLIFIQLIFAVIGAFQASDAVLIMTGGGPDNATLVVGLEIFFNAYMFQQFGVATSMAWILGFLLMGLTVFQMRRLSRMTFTTAET